ncbi:MAG: hypothetical protein ACK56F_21740, partial [bacterium]
DLKCFGPIVINKINTSDVDYELINIVVFRNLIRDLVFSQILIMLFLKCQVIIFLILALAGIFQMLGICNFRLEGSFQLMAFLLLFEPIFFSLFLIFLVLIPLGPFLLFLVSLSAFLLVLVFPQALFKECFCFLIFIYYLEKLIHYLFLL